MRFANDYIPTRLLTDAFAELSEPMWAGGATISRILADQLTLFKPGRQIMPTTLLTARRIFSPTYDPAMP